MSPARRLIQTIYDAAIEPGQWDDALGQITNAVGGNLLGLMGAPGQGPRLTPGVDSRFVELWSHYAMRFEAEHDYPMMKRLGVGRISTMEEMVGERAYMRSEFHAEWARPQRIRYWVNAKLWQDESGMGGIGIGREESRPRFGAVEKHTLAALIPHLQRALHAARRIGQLDARHRGLMSLLDALPVAVILIDGHGIIRATNRSADLLLSSGDGLSAGRDGLWASSPVETSSLRRLAVRAAATGNGNGDAAGGMLVLRRPSGRRPLQVTITPLGRETASAWDAYRPSAAVFVSDPDLTAPPPATRLQTAYGLTPAQAKVAVGLAEGRSLREIAESLEIQMNTARAHLKEIFAKTDTRRQTELVRLLLLGPLSIGVK